MKFRHTGGAGDIIHSLPFVRFMGGGEMAVGGLQAATYDVFTSVKRLLEAQKYISKADRYDEKVPADCDLDALWRDPGNLLRAYALGYFDAFRVYEPQDWKSPWLAVPPRIPPLCESGFAVVNVTERYRDTVDWRFLMAKARARHGSVFFIGTESEHRQFKNEAGDIPFLPTADLYEAAAYISGAEALYCNQSACWTIAQGLGKPFFLEARRAFAHKAVFKLPDEHFLNYEEN